MDVSYSRDAFHTYMVVDGSTKKGAEDTEKMLGNQHSAALLPFHEQQVDEQKKYYYEISGRVELKSYVERQPVGETIISQLIAFILELYRTMEEYLLDPDAILLEAEYLYVDMDENILSAACIPGRKEDFNEQLKLLAAWLLENADHTDREGVLLVYDFYKTVQREDFLPAHLKKFEKKKKVAAEVYEPIQEVYIPQQETVIEPVKDIRTDEPQTVQPAKTKKKGSGNGWMLAAAGGLLVTACMYKFGVIQKVLDEAGTTIPAMYIAAGMAAAIVLISLLFYKLRKDKNRSEDASAGMNMNNVYTFTDDAAEKDLFFAEEKTVVLTGTEGSVRLISMNKHAAPDLVLSEFPCTIGSAKGTRQYTLQVEGISRKHALFEKNQEGIFLSDLNSTNGTKVNGEFLEKDEKRRLMAEDMIEFGSVRFMYCQ